MNSWQYRTPDPDAPRWPSYCVMAGLGACLIAFALYLRSNTKPTHSESAAKAAMEAWMK